MGACRNPDKPAGSCKPRCMWCIRHSVGEAGLGTGEIADELRAHAARVRAFDEEQRELAARLPLDNRPVKP